MRDFVGLHGGDIAVDDAPEGGARFVVKLPLRAPEGVEVRTVVGVVSSLDAARDVVAHLRVVPETGTESLAGGKPPVLVVEDNTEMRRFMVETLGKEFAVVAAEDGERALELAVARRPAAIVTDLMMPAMDGEKLLRAVRNDKTLMGTPVLVLTAKADDELRVRLLRQGAHDYLVKPFVAEELLARVANAVAMKTARDVLAHALQSTSSTSARSRPRLWNSSAISGTRSTRRRWPARRRRGRAARRARSCACSPTRS